MKPPTDDKHHNYYNATYCYWRWSACHGHANERQVEELHMVRKEEKWKMGGMDLLMPAVTMAQLLKGRLYIDLAL